MLILKYNYICRQVPVCLSVAWIAKCFLILFVVASTLHAIQLLNVSSAYFCT